MNRIKFTAKENINLRVSIKLISVYCLLIATTLFTSCKSDAEEADRPDLESIEIRPEVVFTTVNDDPLNFFIESRGVVEPLQRIQLIPRISGFVEQHSIVEGQRVQKGEVILHLNEEEGKNAESQAYNNYLKAKNEFDIEFRLRAGSDSSRERTNELLRITTGLAEAELTYERAKLDLSYTKITAPFAGRISAKEVVSTGAYVSAGQNLGVLIDASKVRVRFDVLESEIDALEEGMPVELFDPSGKNFEGKIVAVSPEVNSETKTGQVLVEVENADYSLKTGMTIEGRVFVRSLKSKVKMPREALLERDGRTLIFKLNNQEVEWVYVTPEAMNTEWVLINHEEISPGDTLAVDQHFSISHQQKVVPLMDFMIHD